MKSDLTYCDILNTRINVINMENTVEYLSENLESLRGSYICVSNVHTTVMAYRDEQYRKVQNESAMNLPDGKPLSIVQKMKGFSQAERVPGPDLMPEIFNISEEKGYRHYFYGSTEHVLEELEKNLKSRFPKLQIAGMYSPPFRPLTDKEDEEAVKRINDARPDFVWVGLGAPKQELWMAEHKDRVKAVMLGVGAGFEFHAGTVKRAPHWMQEYCLEWLFRMFQDPKRLLPRYINTNFSFLYYVWKEERKHKKTQKREEGQKSYKDKRRKSSRKDKQSLRIAMIGHKRIPSREGGVEVVVDELSRRYVKLGHQVDAYNRSGYHVSGKEYDAGRKGKYYSGIRIITVPTFKNGKLNAIVYSILATIRALFGRYDVIHFHAEGPCTMIWLPKLFGIHTVATIHGLDWQRSKWGNFASHVLKFGEKMAAKYADEVIVLSKNMQTYFKETYGRDTVFIPNGINKPEKKEVQEIKERFGLEKDGYILFLARLVPEKGIHYLIEAFEQIKTDKKLVIAGGSSHSYEYMEKIHKMAEKDSRILMPGFVAGRALEELYSNAYFFVLPSDVEGMAVSLLEAMSYGNCCVISDIEENTEVVGDKAVWFRKGDSGDLKIKMQELFENPDMVERYRQESSDYICSKHDWDKVVQQTIDLYRR